MWDRARYAREVFSFIRLWVTSSWPRHGLVHRTDGLESKPSENSNFRSQRLQRCRKDGGSSRSRQYSRAVRFKWSSVRVVSRRIPTKVLIERRGGPQGVFFGAPAQSMSYVTVKQRLRQRLISL